MTNEQINIAIAEAYGWTRIRETAIGVIGNTPDQDMSPMSDDYLAPIRITIGNWEEEVQP